MSEIPYPEIHEMLDELEDHARKAGARVRHLKVFVDHGRREIRFEEMGFELPEGEDRREDAPALPCADQIAPRDHS